MQETRRVDFRWRLLAAISVPALMLGACAGGGSGGSSAVVPSPSPPAPPPPPPPPPTPASFETDEYFRAGGLAVIGASTAYAEGATGAGQLVAVIDTGTDSGHPDLVGQVQGTTFDVNAAERAPDDIDTSGHGTLVSGVIAARRNPGSLDPGIHGVAYGARILDIRADRPDSCRDSDLGENCEYRNADLIAGIDYALSQGAKVINLSLGGPIGGNSTLEAKIREATSQAIIVISAGNEADNDPDSAFRPNSPGFIAGSPSTNGRVVTVGAISINDDPATPDVDETGKITDFSNRAGPDAQGFYILAPGEDIVSTGPDDNIVFPDDPDCSATVTEACNDPDDVGDYYRISGTSFAAPHVSGSLALLLEAFPNLALEDAVSILLESADDYVDDEIDPIAGVAAGPGTDAVSGVGILNLETAFSPIGTTSLSVAGESMSAVEAYAAPAAGAFGDWAVGTSGLGRLAVVDAYERAFSVDARAAAGTARPPLADLAQRVDWLAGDHHAVQAGRLDFSWSRRRLWEDPTAPYQAEPQPRFTARLAMADGEVAFGRGGGPGSSAPTASLISTPGRPDSPEGETSWARLIHDLGFAAADLVTVEGPARSETGVGLTRTGRGWHLRGGVALIEDRGTALGAQMQSRFGGEDRSELAAYDLSGGLALASAWHLSFGLEAAQVALPGVEVDGIWTSRWSLGASRPLGIGQLSLILAQPRRAETGTLTLEDAVTGATEAGLVRETVDLPLTPSGRQIDLEARYGLALSDTVSGELSGALTTAPNHVADAEPAGVFWLGLRSIW